MRGKWAAGIMPRNFAWIIKGHLAVSERPGGSASVHRRVRRHEEILWLRGHGFTKIVSLLPSPHNLHAYEELGVGREHIPLAVHDDPLPTLTELYPSLLRWMYGGERVLVHQDQLDERLAGVLGGFLFWSGLVPELPLAISAIENLLRRQLGASGRTIATLALAVAAPTEEDRRRPERPSEAVLLAIAEGRLGPVVDMPRAVPVSEPIEASEAPVEPDPSPAENTPPAPRASRARSSQPRGRATTPAKPLHAKEAKATARKQPAKRVAAKAGAPAKAATKNGARRRVPPATEAGAAKASAASRAVRSRSSTGGAAVARRSRAALAREAGTKRASTTRRTTTRRRATGTA